MSDKPRWFTPSRLITIALVTAAVVISLPQLIPAVLGFAILLALIIPLAAVEAALRWAWNNVRRIRLHLSTLLLLTILAGAFVGAQFWEREYSRNHTGEWKIWRQRGLPFTYEQWYADVDSEFCIGPRFLDTNRELSIAVNSVIGLAGLVLVGCVSEGIIRRRKT
ncbi:MAG TPA: hypothetical protein VEJ63_19920 [Planctomycetota bacterium]|nr:hypothetical protein [Planctomycetota bacterium]